MTKTKTTNLACTSGTSPPTASDRKAAPMEDQTIKTKRTTRRLPTLTAAGARRGVHATLRHICAAYLEHTTVGLDELLTAWIESQDFTHLLDLDMDDYIALGRDLGYADVMTYYGYGCFFGADLPDAVLRPHRDAIAAYRAKQAKEAA